MTVTTNDFQSDAQYLFKTDRQLWINTFLHSIQDVNCLKELLKGHFIHSSDLFSAVPEILEPLVNAILEQDPIHLSPQDSYAVIVSALSIHVKKQLLPLLKKKGLSGVVELFVGDDLEIYKYLLEDSDLAEYHLVPIFPSSWDFGKISFSSSWKEKAILAVKAGYKEQAIAERVVYCVSYQLHRANAYQNLISEFELLESEEQEILRKIGKCGQALIKPKLEDANKEYEKRTIFGDDRHSF